MDEALRGFKAYRGKCCIQGYTRVLGGGAATERIVRRVRKHSDAEEEPCTTAAECAVACSTTSRDGYKMKMKIGL
jgi:hypothetical protein